MLRWQNLKINRTRHVCIRVTLPVTDLFTEFLRIPALKSAVSVIIEVILLFYFVYGIRSKNAQMPL